MSYITLIYVKGGGGGWHSGLAKSVGDVYVNIDSN